MAQIAQKLDRYYGLMPEAAVDKLCLPLKAFDISYFLYTRVYRDKSTFWLTNNLPWSKHFYKQKLYEKDVFAADSLATKMEVFLWESLPCQAIYQQARELFGIDNGITFVRHCNEYLETWHYATTPDNPRIIDFYINNLHLLEHFMHYFLCKGGKVIREMEKWRHLVPKLVVNDNFNELLNNNEKKIKEFFEATELSRYYLDGERKEVYLTKRELECIDWLRHGKSAEEVSSILESSSYTVKTHIENVKKKLDCHKQFALGYRIGSLGIFPK